MTARPRRRDSLWIALGLAALAAVLAVTQVTWRLDRVVYDQALSWWSRPAPPQITVIAIDDASLSAIGRWPWPRAVHATLLEQLAAARPKAVALDLVLSEADADPRQDALLARAMQQAAPVVVPLTWVSADGAAPRWLTPTPALAAAAQLASAETAVDEDGVLRSAFLHVGDAQARLPHVALALMQAAGETVHPAIRVQAPPAPSDSWQRSDRMLIRYGGPPGHVTRLSYIDVLGGAVPVDQLRGRYLLVGMTAQGLGDTLATPVNAGHSAMPGVEVLAQTLHMLRSGDGLRAPSPGALAALWALLVGLGVLAMVRLSQRAALLGALGAATGVLAASVAALQAGWWLAPTPAIAAALLAYPLWSWRRLELAVRGLDDEIRRLDADTPHTPMAALSRDAIGGRLQRLHAATDLLRSARRYLADVLESLPTATLVADEQHRVLMANAQAALLFEAGEAVDLNGLDLRRLLREFSTDEAQDWAQVLAALRPGEPALSLQARLAEQGDYVIQLSAADLAGDRRVLVSVADVAPVKRAERQREEALAFVTHDLRSPASAILLLTDAALARGSVPADWLPQVRALAARSLELSEAFVRYAQADLVAPQPVHTELQGLLDEATAALRPQAEAAGVSLTLAVASASDAALLDRALVSRALANLVSNAIRHSPRGGRVLLRVSTAPGTVWFEVADDGPGLSADQQQVLERTEDGLRSGYADGVGLGLRFVQRVARRHGGQLRWRPRDAGQPGLFELRLRDGGVTLAVPLR